MTLALLIFGALFDWVWLRPMIQSYVHDRSGRQIDFDGLDVGFDRALQPIVRFSNLRIENAPWADSRPLITAEAFSLAFAWRSFTGDRLIITRMLMEGADVDLERQPDGLRNWRISRPDDRGPGRVRVLSLDARRSKLRFVHHGIDLHLDLQTAPLAAPRRLTAAPDLPLTKSLAFQGSRHGSEFEGTTDISEVITFFDTGQAFALQGHLQTSHTHLDVEGQGKDLAAFSGIDVDLRLTGTRPAEMAQVFGRMPYLPVLATDLRGHLNKDDAHWLLSRLNGRIGNSDLAGSLEFQPRRDGVNRASVRVDLSGKRWDLSELLLTGPRPTPRATVVQAKGAATEPGRLRETDADIDLNVASITGVPAGAIGALRTHAALRSGRLEVATIEFAIAGGHASGSLVLDAAQSVPQAAADLRFRRLDLQQLLGARANREQIEGRLDLRMALQAQGASLDAMKNSLAGSLTAGLVDASMPAALDAKLGLDGGRWLRAKLGSGERTPITCSVLEMRFDAGKGTVRRLAVDTDRVALDGAGVVDVQARSFDLLLTPRRKQTALLALDRSIRVAGAFGSTKVALVNAEAPSRREPCQPGAAP